MPSVPVYDLPTQELASTQLNTFQAPNVQGMSDVSGKQISEMGKATLGLGVQFQKLADEVRDANVKSGDTAFLGKMQDILYNKESGFMWKKNKDAMEGAKDTYDQFNKAASEVRSTLTDPAEQQAFDGAVRRHAVTFGANVNKHAGEQMFNYKKTEAEARASNYGDAAIAAFGKPEFQTYLKTTHAEINALADMSGLGAEARKEAILKANSHIYGNVVTNLAINNKFTEAKSVLDKAIADGEITQQSATQLNRMIKTGYTDEQGRKIADNLTAGRPAIGTDSQSIISYVREQHEGSKFVEDDAGKGATKYGINVMAYFNVKDKSKITQEQIDFIKNLTPEKADEIYKKNYWDALNIEKLPENMRAIAFDAGVNQGVPWAKGAIAEAMKSDNPAQALIDIRRKRYATIVENNPGQYKQFEGGWSKRMDAYQSMLTGTTRPLTYQESVASVEAMEKSGIISEEEKKSAISRLDSNNRMQLNGQAAFGRAQIEGARDWMKQNPNADLSQMPLLLRDNLQKSKHWDDVVAANKNGGKFANNNTIWGQFLLMPDRQKAEMTVDQFVNDYGGKLSDSALQQGISMISELRGEVKKGQGTNLVSNEDVLKEVAKENKIIPYEGKQDETQQKAYATFRNEVQRRVEVFEQSKGGTHKVTPAELKDISNGVLLDKVKTGGLWGMFASEKPVTMLKPDQMKDAFVDVQLSGQSRRIKLSEIGEKSRERYIKILRDNGLPVTQYNIAEMHAKNNPLED